MIRGQSLGEQRHHCHGPFGLAPFADLAHRLIDAPCRGDDRALEAVRMRSAELRHVPMIGADHRDLDRSIVNADKTEPRGRDQKMDVGPLIVHVHDAVLGLIVLCARPRSLAAHPPRVPAGKAFAWRLLAKDPTVGVLGAGAVRVHLASARPAVGCQFRQPRAKVRIDILVQDFGGGIDVSVGVIDPEAIFHCFSPWLASWPGTRSIERAGSRSCRCNRTCIRPGLSMTLGVRSVGVQNQLRRPMTNEGETQRCTPRTW